MPYLRRKTHKRLKGAKRHSGQSRKKFQEPRVFIPGQGSRHSQIEGLVVQLRQHR